MCPPNIRLIRRTHTLNDTLPHKCHHHHQSKQSCAWSRPARVLRRPPGAPGVSTPAPLALALHRTRSPHTRARRTLAARARLCSYRSQSAGDGSPQRSGPAYRPRPFITRNARGSTRFVNTLHTIHHAGSPAHRSLVNPDLSTQQGPGLSALPKHTTAPPVSRTSRFHNPPLRSHTQIHLLRGIVPTQATNCPGRHGLNSFRTQQPGYVCDMW